MNSKVTRKQLKYLTREHIQVIHSDFNEFWPVATTHCCDKNPERVSVPTASFESYGRFTEFLAKS